MRIAAAQRHIPAANSNNRVHRFSADQVIASLQSTADGLTSAEALKRQSEFGPNTILQIDQEPIVVKLLRGFTHFFALILWCGAGIAFFAAWKDPASGMSLLGWAILGVIFINGLFSFWQEYRAEQAIAALQQLIPHRVTALRDGQLVQLPASELVPGDVVALEEGDDVPADCRLIAASGVRVNNATITGESLPQARDLRPSQEDDLIHSKNMLLAGTSVFSGQCQAIIVATGMHTEFGKIARLTQTAPEVLSPLQKEIVRLSRVIASIALAIGILFFLIGCVIGLSFWRNAIFALGIIVALVPEGLLPEVTLALATCSRRMAKRNALIRHLSSVETLGCTTVICTDKTGTLTENHMSVRKVFLAGRWLDEFKEPLLGRLVEAGRRLHEVALNCHDVKTLQKEGKTVLSGDPMEVALVEFARQSGFSPEPFPRLEDIPFDTDRKRQSTLNDTGGSHRLLTKGALELLLPICRNVLTENGEEGLSEAHRAEFLKAQDMMAKGGLRVLAFAVRETEQACPVDRLEANLVLVGLVGLEDPPRAEVPAAIRKCRQAGIKVIMVTGDHPATALAIAREINLVESAHPELITGPQLCQLSDTQLQLLLDAEEIVFARADADQKMRIVNALKRKRQIVCVTGDGVNDAPALKAADIGIAMGLTGTDVARAASDMILADDNFSSIVNAIEEGRAVFANIRKFLTYVLASNIAELIPCLCFVLFRVPLPLTVMQILSVDLGTDLLPALALGVEPPDSEVMGRPPRSSREGLFDLALLARAYLWLGAIVSVGSMAAFFFVLTNGGWHYGQDLASTDTLYLQATTACLTGIICMQAVNSSMCRSERQSLFALGLFSNKLLLFGVAVQLALILFIDYTSSGNAIFKTHAIPLQVWLFILPFMALMTVAEEMRKLMLRRRGRRQMLSANPE
jgi:calcium-translocating P-type ATPase